jgi:hypothetical protein
VRLAEWSHRLAVPVIETARQELIQLVTQYGSAKSETKSKIKAEIIKRADTIQSQARYALAVRQKAATLSGGKIVLFYVFALRFLAALLALIVVFAGIYRGLHRLSPGSFSGDGMKSLWFSFYYSVVTFFTVGDGSVSPQGPASQVAVVAQVLFAVITLTVLAMSFSTLSVDLAQENGAAVEGVARRHFEYCMEVMRRYLGVIKDSPVDALADLNTQFDKHIRRVQRNKEKTDMQAKIPDVEPEPQKEAPASPPSEPTEQG